MIAEPGSPPAALAAAAVLSLLPGAALLAPGERGADDALERLGAAVATSWAFWACFLWVVPPGHWTLAAAAVVAVSLAVSLAAVALRSRTPPPRDGAPPSGSRLSGVLLVLLLLSIALRVATAFHRAPPSTGDLTMHAYMTELVRLADGLPATHEPLLPISTFGQNSPGLHGMAALVSRASGVPADRAALLLGCLALVVLALSLDRVLRALLPGTPRTARGAAAFGALLLARNPQLFLTWGGVPTIASIALVFFVFAEALEWTPRFDAARALRAGLVGAGAVLTHLLPVVAALYVAAPIVLAAAVRRRSRAALANAALAVAVAAALVARFVHRTSLTPSPSTVAWARDWIRGELEHAAIPQHLVLGRFGASGAAADYLALPFFWLVFVGILASIVLAAWLVVRARRPNDALPVVAAILGILALLHVASLAECLPYWMALYPYRVHLFLLVPVGVAFAELFAWAAATRPRRLGAAGVLVLLTAVTALAVRRAGPNGDEDLGGLAFDAASRTWLDTMNARVGPDDLAAFSWIAEHTPDDAVVANAEGDGGQLLPGRVHRKVTLPHYQKFWYEDEFTRWAAAHPPGWLFSGAHPSPAYPSPWAVAAIEAGGEWEPALRSGDARVSRRAGAAEPAGGAP